MAFFRSRNCTRFYEGVKCYNQSEDVNRMFLPRDTKPNSSICSKPRLSDDQVCKMMHSK